MRTWRRRLIFLGAALLLTACKVTAPDPSTFTAAHSAFDEIRRGDTAALNSQLAELRNYPNDFPYLKSAAPIVLGSTPGTAANQEPNPLWLLGGAVGPIARRLFDTVARTRWDSERPSLIRILNFTADRQSIGPQELTGTVSWSDWLPYLHKFDAASFKQ